MNRAGVVVEGAKVDRVFPRQPRVRRRLKRDEDLLELFASRNLFEEIHLSVFGHRDVFGVALRERGTIQLVEVRDLERVEQVPVIVVLGALHELVRDPDGGVRGSRASVGVTGVLTEVEELGEVEVPVLHVEAERTELLAAA